MSRREPRTPCVLDSTLEQDVVGSNRHSAVRLVAVGKRLVVDKHLTRTSTRRLCHRVRRLCHRHCLLSGCRGHHLLLLLCAVNGGECVSRMLAEALVHIPESCCVVRMRSSLPGAPSRRFVVLTLAGVWTCAVQQHVIAAPWLNARQIHPSVPSCTTSRQPTCTSHHSYHSCLMLRSC